MTKLLVSAADVDARIGELATEIATDLEDSHPLFVALLRGAAPFATKLMFAIQAASPSFHPELDYMMVSTYGSGKKAGEPHIVTDLAPTTAVSGRTVVILDDVLDKGVTAHFVTNHVKARGAANVKLAVLAEKRTKKQWPIQADYRGFIFDDIWLVGMGMDDADSGKEHRRWLASIEDATPN